MLAIFKREFKSYFISPIGYIFLAAFTFFEAMFFSLLFTSGSTQIQYIITSISSVVVFALPILTMKMLSEDRRQKVDQVLLTAPISVTAIVMGKLLATLSVFMLAFAPTLIFQIIVSTLATANWCNYLYCLFGVMLLGAAMISIGMFISSLTESSVVAAILTIVVNFIVMMATSFASTLSSELLTKVAESISFIDRFSNFSSSMLSIADIVYFLSITVVFVFLSVRSVERRRWA